jgi:hypothetical protein
VIEREQNETLKDFVETNFQRFTEMIAAGNRTGF